jgi:anti-anti-sigma regulatory factor
MHSPTKPGSIRIALDPNNTAAFLQEMRAALTTDPNAALVVDMSGVAYAGPKVLETLRTALEDTRQVGREVWVDHVVSDVYKSLQLSKLGPFFKRVHRGGGG